MVLAVDRQGQSITVSHREISGYMPAMVMPFRVRDSRSLDGLHPGARITFRLSNGAASKIRKVASGAEGVNEGDAIPIPVPPEKIAIGQPVPEFELTDQLGRPVRLSALKGRVVAVNFIYTRCPLPEVCPRLSAGFARIQRRFRDRMGTDLVLLSITIDPQYDTVEVLAEYARIWRADSSGWHMLTGPHDRIREVAARFGLVYWPEEGAITHTSVTGVIARDGRLAALIEGSSYDPAQLGDLITGQWEAK